MSNSTGIVTGTATTPVSTCCSTSRGDYDILIEVFDAGTSEFLAYFGPEDTSELAFLPLEDMDRDAPVPETRITVNSGGGGASDWLLLALLGIFATVSGLRRFTKQRCCP